MSDIERIAKELREYHEVDYGKIEVGEYEDTEHYPPICAEAANTIEILLARALKYEQALREIKKAFKSCNGDHIDAAFRMYAIARAALDKPEEK